MSVVVDRAAFDSGASDPVGSHQQCVTGIDHIAIAVANLQEAVEWYTGKLGFEVRKFGTTRGESSSMDWAVLVAGNVPLVLAQGNERHSQITQFVENCGPGVQHVALAVQDLDEALARIQAAGGVAETPVVEDPGIRQVFLRREAGSGVRVELIERRGGDFSESSIEQLFRAFESASIW